MKGSIFTIDLFFLALVLAASPACSNVSQEEPKASSAIIIENVEPEVDRYNYISGHQFCEQFPSTTGHEYGNFIQVPKNYSDPSSETIEIYAWTNKPFNPELPTFINVDGGPGQNSHGFPDIFNLSWNEIHFDQRGVGCSAPRSFDEYRDASLYSSSLTVLDMDRIRQFYKIQKWSVYGISYGTIPATQYASQFPESTQAIALEGTVYDGRNIHDEQWKAEKLNLVLNQLNPSQKRGFKKVMTSRYESTLVSLINQFFFADLGLQKLLQFLNSVIQDENNIAWERLEEVRISLGKKNAIGILGQRPMTVDRQVNIVIFCRELGVSSRSTYLSYDLNSEDFVVRPYNLNPMIQDCLDHGVSMGSQNLYQASNHPVQVPVTYFQGSHDGATLARGAILHWSTVPQGEVNFLLRRRGGHNPNTLGLVSRDNFVLHQAYSNVFSYALKGKRLHRYQVDEINNFYSPSNQWLLFHSKPRNLESLERESAGIRFDQVF